MSWSVSAMGRIEAVKQSLQKQFESAKSATKWIAHEERSVAIVENLVNNELEALKHSEMKVIHVEAGGSASAQSGRVLSSEVRVTIKPVYGFVE